MGMRVKRVLSTVLAFMMVAMLCMLAVPAYQVRAATKSVSVKLEQGGGEKDIEMSRGKKIQLKVKKNGQTLGRKTVTYKVSGKSIISCSKSGLIVAKKSGDAEIEIKDKNSDFTATVYVEVTGGGSGKGAHVDKIWLDKSEITLDLGQGYTARVYTSGDNGAGSFRWTSENSDIATVDDHGNIRAVGHGTTIIHCQKAGKDAAMKVNVN
ncbi:Ig-like domain-containing protein [Butyrivibrio sp. WCE2006]|uniref:Ig-like domain-containing protein n=1 Tax=Butyrivibrio sp. WCE2006 TaxID=1410611 RepID=UPI0005D2C5DB|nr:Ig-like domain-containing protein [Butyrivibrio sp. WCE2006]